MATACVDTVEDKPETEAVKVVPNAALALVSFEIAKAFEDILASFAMDLTDAPLAVVSTVSTLEFRTDTAAVLADVSSAIASCVLAMDAAWVLTVSLRSWTVETSTHDTCSNSTKLVPDPEHRMKGIISS